MPLVPRGKKAWKSWLYPHWRACEASDWLASVNFGAPGRTGSPHRRITSTMYPSGTWSQSSLSGHEATGENVGLRGVLVWAAAGAAVKANAGTVAAAPARIPACSIPRRLRRRCMSCSNVSDSTERRGRLWLEVVDFVTSGTLWMESLETIDRKCCRDESEMNTRCAPGLLLSGGYLRRLRTPDRCSSQIRRSQETGPCWRCRGKRPSDPVKSCARSWPGCRSCGSPANRLSSEYR